MAESQKIRANFLTPAHKSGAYLHPAIERYVSIPHQYDLPALPNLDNPHAPEGVIEQTQILAADTFTSSGSKYWHTFFLVNGASSGLHAALLATVRPGRKIIVQRNIPQCVVNALILCGADPIWVYPEYEPLLDLAHGVHASDIGAALNAHSGEVDAVLVLSPTHHGIASDISTIAALVHEANIALIVDESYGAHFKFHSDLPESATECDADLVVHATHYSLSGMLQTGMLHVKKHSNNIDFNRVCSAVSVVQPANPSYLLLTSIEAVCAEMRARGPLHMEKTIELARQCAKRISSLQGFRVLSELGQGWERDETRVTVVMENGESGYDLDTNLIERFGIYCELPSFRRVTLVFSVGNTQEEVDLLITALSLIAITRPEGILIAEQVESFPALSQITGIPRGITPREAFFAETEEVDLMECVGRISANSLTPHPPGIPVVASGEQITSECVNVLMRVLDAGGSVSGAEDGTLERIRVIKEADA